MSVLHGDCRIVLRTLADNSVDLVYLDPPFFTQKSHSLITRDSTSEYIFHDRWDSLSEYLDFIRDVLAQVKRLLKDTGSIFLHCDKSASHHLRVLLDEVFGIDNFQSEIIWSYRRWSNSKKGLLNAHQTIYFYSKTNEFKFNTTYTDYSPTTNIDQILQARERNGLRKSAYMRDENGDTILGKEKRGVPLSDVWNIPYLNPKAKERVGYPTQKPLLLLERIIEIATDSGDLVLDPFSGSGTTLVAAKLAERNYIGIDISGEAVELSQKRLGNPIKSESRLLIEGEESYLEKTEYERKILAALDAIPVERNKGIDGFLRNFVEERPVSIRIQKEGESLETAKQKIITASKSKKCSLMILVRTQNDNAPSFIEIDHPYLMVIDAYDLIVQGWIQNREVSNAKSDSKNKTDQKIYQAHL